MLTRGCPPIIRGVAAFTIVAVDGCSFRHRVLQVAFRIRLLRLELRDSLVVLLQNGQCFASQCFQIRIICCAKARTSGFCVFERASWETLISAMLLCAARLTNSFEVSLEVASEAKRIPSKTNLRQCGRRRWS